MMQTSPAVKAAELTLTLVAIILSADMALFAPDFLRAHAGTFLLVGLLMHASGMPFKYRLEVRERPSLAWEHTLFLLCWIILIALAAWLVLQVMGQ